MKEEDSYLKTFWDLVILDYTINGACGYNW